MSAPWALLTPQVILSLAATFMALWSLSRRGKMRVTASRYAALFALAAFPFAAVRWTLGWSSGGPFVASFIMVAAASALWWLTVRLSRFEA